MKITIHSINQKAKRDEYETPNSKDIYHAQNLIDNYLLSHGYEKGIETLTVKPQGFGHGAPRVHMPYSAKGVLIDSLVYFNPNDDSSVLEVCVAVQPDKLEAILFNIMMGSCLPMKKWNSYNLGLININDNFADLSKNYFPSVMDIVKRFEEFKARKPKIRRK